MPRRIGDVRLSNTGLGIAGAARGRDAITAIVASNLDYILALEYGHSAQAPAGMVRINKARIQAIGRQALRRAAGQTSDPREALLMSVVETALAAEAIIATDTPVDTGTAKNSWTVRLPREAGGVL